MQSVSSRIWTRVTVSVSYDDNDNTTGSEMRKQTDNKFRTLRLMTIISETFSYFRLCANLSSINDNNILNWFQNIIRILQNRSVQYLDYNGVRSYQNKNKNL